MYKFFIILLLAIIGILSSVVLKEDNVIEEVVEEVIKQETNITIDLSPNSLE